MNLDVEQCKASNSGNKGEVGDVYVLTSGDKATVDSYSRMDNHGMRYYMVTIITNGITIKREASKYHLTRGTVAIPSPETLVQGRGYNSTGNVYTKLESVYRAKWNTMLERTNPVNKDQYPTYHDVTVDPVFYDFQAFMKHMRYLFTLMGMTDSDALTAKLHLDKDILGDGKQYGPGKICLVPAKLNQSFSSLNRRPFNIVPGRGPGSPRCFSFFYASFGKKFEFRSSIMLSGVPGGALILRGKMRELIKFTQDSYDKQVKFKDPRITDLIHDDVRLGKKFYRLDISDITQVENELWRILKGEPEMDFETLPESKVSKLSYNTYGVQFDIRHTSSDAIRRIASITQEPKTPLFGLSLFKGTIMFYDVDGKKRSLPLPLDDLGKLEENVRKASDGHLGYKTVLLRKLAEIHTVPSEEGLTLSEETLALMRDAKEELRKLQGHTEDNIRKFIDAAIEHKTNWVSL